MATLTRMERYLESLPNGLDSYQAYTQKAVIVRQFLETTPELARGVSLPPRLAELVAHPPPVSQWLPEAQGTALMLAGTDMIGSEAEFVERFYRGNVRLLSGPLYRMMMLLASPRLILSKFESRWSMFHRGVRLRVELRPDSNTAALHLSYPMNLLPELVARAYTGAFRAGLEAAGGEQVRIGTDRYSDTAAHFEGSWR